MSLIGLASLAAGLAVGSAVASALTLRYRRRIWRLSRLRPAPGGHLRRGWLRMALLLPAWGGLPGGREQYTAAVVRAELGEAREGEELWRRELGAAWLVAMVAAVGSWVGWDGPTTGVAAVAAGAGLAVPLGFRGWLRRKAAQRQERLLAQLPAWVDLLVLALEAGMPVRQALLLAARYAPSAWRGLSARLVSRLEYGASLEQAVAAVREEVEPGPARTVLRALAVGEKAGVDQAELLRQQAEYARALALRRWQARVGVLPVQLMLIGVLMLLPPVLVLLLWPQLVTLSTRW